MSRSLKGLRILNTRPQNQAHQLSQSINEAGGLSIELPVLEIIATDSKWINSLPDLSKVQQAVFVSANAVYHCFSQLNQRHIHWPSTIKVIAIGQGSARALAAFKVQVSAMPDVPDSEHVLALKTIQELKNQTMLLFKGEGGRPLIERSLLERGAHLITLNVYQRVMPQINPQLIKSIWRNDLVDIILLTSEESMHNLFKLFDKDAHHWLRSKPCLVFSTRLAQSASILGIQKIIISHPDRMMDELFDYVN